jgi:hypothetical protein
MPFSADTRPPALTCGIVVGCALRSGVGLALLRQRSEAHNEPPTCRCHCPCASRLQVTGKRLATTTRRSLKAVSASCAYHSRMRTRQLCTHESPGSAQGSELPKACLGPSIMIKRSD